MKLSHYLRENEITIAEFTRRSGIPHRQYTWRYFHGTRIPGPVDMERIYRATGGAVTANDFYGLEESASQSVLPGDAASPEVQEVAE